MDMVLRADEKALKRIVAMAAEFYALANRVFYGT